MRLGTSAKLLIAMHDLYQPTVTEPQIGTRPRLRLATSLTLETAITNERVDGNTAEDAHNGKDVAFGVGIVDQRPIGFDDRAWPHHPVLDIPAESLCRDNRNVTQKAHSEESGLRICGDVRADAIACPFN